MRNLILLAVTGMLLGLLAGTTLVVVQEGEAHTRRMGLGMSPDTAVADSAAAEVIADSTEMATGGPSVLALSDADSSAMRELAETPVDSTAPTPVDGRGTPLQADMTVVSAAATEHRSVSTPMPGPEDLARYLSSMQPREAARVLEQMTDTEVATILAMIGGRRASAIMGSLAPERAAAIGRLALGSKLEEVS